MIVGKIHRCNKFIRYDKKEIEEYGKGRVQNG